MSTDMYLNPKLFNSDVEQEAVRSGFGKGLLAAGKQNEAIVALCADLTGSTQMDKFANEFPDRFINVGVAEQNLVTVGAGMAAMGKIPFVSSYAAFSPGRNWEQIRTTICLNDVPVKIVGSHAGLYTGPDGATHQMLEDIALMRVLPNMQVVVPCDALEAEKATLAIAKSSKPAYIRIARDSSPIITTENTPFSIGQAQILRKGSDITIIACGPLVFEALKAAEKLAKYNIDAEVINCATIKPLDTKTIIESVKKTRHIITVEEAQVTGGLGGAIAEVVGEVIPTPLMRLGMKDEFGESGKPEELFEHFGLTSPHIIEAAKGLIKK